MSRIIKSPALSDEVFQITDEEVAKSKKLKAKSLAEKIVVQAKEDAFRIKQDSERQAEKILAEVNQTRQDQVATATTEIEVLKESAKQEGFDQGLQEGRDKSQKEILKEKERLSADFAQKVSGLIDSIHIEKEKLVQGSRSQLTDLACEIASRIVRHEVKSDHGVIIDIVKESLSRATQQKKVTLRLNEEDLDWVKQNCASFIESHETLKEINFEKDGRIEPGGCIVETQSSYVDARLERQLDEIRRNLKE